MTTLMKLENIAQQTPIEIISVNAGDLLLGRDSENSVVIDETAISRVHGNIFEVAGYWFFRDLNSTNGSAINGEKISPEQIRILRSGDIIHLATFPILYTEIKPKVVSADTGSLLVFLDSGFQSEFNFNSTNSKFTLGGKGADFVLDNLTPGTIALEFEFSSSDMSLRMTSVEPQVTVELNGHAIGSTKPYLLDKDEIVVNNYRLIVNLIGLKSPLAEEKKNEPFLQKKFLEDWQDTSGKSSANQQSRFVFTSTKEESSVKDTVTMKSSDLMLGVGQFGVSQRMSAGSYGEEGISDPEVEQKYVHFGLMVLTISLLAVVILIKILVT